MNHSTLVALAVAVALFPGVVPCQNVTSTILAPNPITMQYSVGAQITQSTQPPGTLPAQGGVTAALGAFPYLASAQANWFRHDEASRSQVVLGNWLQVDPSASAVATIWAHEFVAEFNAPSPVPVTLNITRNSNQIAGSPWPSIGIDVGNDGTIEVPNLSTSGPFRVASRVGPQPLQVRVLFGGQALLAGYSSHIVGIEALPDNALGIVRNSLSCGPAFMYTEPVFAGRGVMVVSDPGVVVIGLSTQPLLLQPAPFPSVIPWPCLLMPSPDIVLWSPGGLHIPLPASMRPVQFHVQVVFVSQGYGLWTTDGFTIDAQ